MNKIKSISVFCGSKEGTNSIYTEQGYLLGKTMAERNMTVVYGGAQVGVMGSVANGALENGGKAIGIIPTFLCIKEVAHDTLSELIVVETMHERKKLLHEKCDAIIALPGGYGTMEELFEILTWVQLGLEKKPIGVLNVNGFYTPLKDLVAMMVKEGFVSALDQQRMLFAESIDELLSLMENYEIPTVTKLIAEDEV